MFIYIIYLLHGAGYYLKNLWSLILSKIFLLSLWNPKFITVLTKPTIGPYPEPVESSPPHRSLSPWSPS